MRKINSKMTLTTKAAFNSIFLGNKLWYKKELGKIKNNFQVWGLIHYLARSGLHLVIIATIWQSVCVMIQVPIIISNVVVLFFMIIFSLLSWPALPFIRAFIMLASYKLCNFFELQTNLLHILNISCILTLLNNPTSLFFLDFQLSFSLTYGLVLFNEISRIKNYNVLKSSIDSKKTKSL
jgi:ComEC/Rec2-related protein